MKTIILISTLFCVCTAGSTLNLDFTKKIPLNTAIEALGVPDTSYILWEETLVLYYGHFKCYLISEEEMVLIGIDIDSGTFGKYEIGMSKRKISKIFGKPSSSDKLPTRELFVYEYRNKYAVVLDIRDKKLVQVQIHRL